MFNSLADCFLDHRLVELEVECVDGSDAFFWDGSSFFDIEDDDGERPGVIEVVGEESVVKEVCLVLLELSSDELFDELHGGLPEGVVESGL